VTSFLLSLNPTLLYRENSTGRTPLEMSRDIYTASLVADPPSITDGNHFFNHYNPAYTNSSSIINQPASNFAIKDKGEEESKKRTWEICAKVDGEIEGEGKERKRRLVSLFEANEVARRVGGSNRGVGGHQMIVNGGLVEEGKPDVVSEWMGNVQGMTW